MLSSGEDPAMCSELKMQYYRKNSGEEDTTEDKKRRI